MLKNIDKAQALVLKNQVAYQQGQVVSKTLAQNQALSITLFSFDKGEGISAHKSKGDAFVTCLDGKGKITVDNKNYQVKKGDLLIYNSGVTHCEKSNETDPMEILFIAYDKLEITNLPPNSLLPESYGPIFHTEEMYDVFHRYFTALITEFELKERFYMEICQNISRTLIMYIFRLINRTENASALLDKSMTMETVLAYIDENFKRKLTLDEVAEKCYTSKYYLSHLFTRFQGVSIGKYILDKKIDESKKMLASSDFPVVTIAESLGFDDPSYYSRIFKKIVGITPLQFRKTASSDK